MGRDLADCIVSSVGLHKFSRENPGKPGNRSDVVVRTISGAAVAACTQAAECADGYHVRYMLGMCLEKSRTEESNSGKVETSKLGGCALICAGSLEGESGGDAGDGATVVGDDYVVVAEVFGANGVDG